MLVSYCKYNYKLNYNITNLVKLCLIDYKCRYVFETPTKSLILLIGYFFASRSLSER